MYVKRTVKRRGDKSYEYLSLVEAVRDGDRVSQRTLFQLGEAARLRESGELDRIIAALERFSSDEWVRAGDIDAESAPSVGAVDAVRTVWDRLDLDTFFGKAGAEHGLGYSLADAAFTMVTNRLVAPSSKRRLIDWADSEIHLGDDVAVPQLHQLYRALDRIADLKNDLETHLYSRLCDLTNLDLRFVFYDVTSTYFETRRADGDNGLRMFGYSRDKRKDRPQVVIGLLCTSDGLPIAHHVFAGNTADRSTLEIVCTDLKERFGVGRVCLVADRGLISADNLETLQQQGFDWVIATRLHRDKTVAAALESSSEPCTRWLPVPGARSAVADVDADDRRHLVVASVARWIDNTRTRTRLVAATEAKYLALENTVRAGRLKNAKKIAARAATIATESPVAGLFDVEIDTGHFLYHYNEPAMDYEELLAGRWILTTNLNAKTLSPESAVTTYRNLLEVEDRFRELKDFIGLRPVYHWTDTRIRGHIAVCVLAALVEKLISADLATNEITDPQIAAQTITARRALRELAKIRRVTLSTGERAITTVTRPSPLASKIATAIRMSPARWNKPTIA